MLLEQIHWQVLFLILVQPLILSIKEYLNKHNKPARSSDNVCPSGLYRYECCKYRLYTSTFMETAHVVEWCSMR